MSSQLGLGVFGTFGQPAGFQQVFHMGAHFNADLDLDENAIEVYPGTDLYAFRREMVDGVVSVCFCIYSYVQEQRSDRFSTFLGTCVVLKDSYTEAEYIYKLLKDLHHTILSDPKTVSGNTIQAPEAKTITVGEPKDLVAVQANIIPISKTPFYSITVDAQKQYIVLPPLGTQQEQSIITFFDEAFKYYNDAGTLFFSFDPNVAEFAAKAGIIRPIAWDEYIKYKELKQQQAVVRTKKGIRKDGVPAPAIAEVKVADSVPVPIVVVENDTPADLEPDDDPYRPFDLWEEPSEGWPQNEAKYRTKEYNRLFKYTNTLQAHIYEPAGQAKKKGRGLLKKKEKNVAAQLQESLAMPHIEAQPEQKKEKKGFFSRKKKEQAITGLSEMVDTIPEIGEIKEQVKEEKKSILSKKEQVVEIAVALPDEELDLEAEFAKQQAQQEQKKSLFGKKEKAAAAITVLPEEELDLEQEFAKQQAKKEKKRGLFRRKEKVVATALALPDEELDLEQEFERQQAKAEKKRGFFRRKERALRSTLIIPGEELSLDQQYAEQQQPKKKKKRALALIGALVVALCSALYFSSDDRQTGTLAANTATANDPVQQGSPAAGSPKQEQQQRLHTKDVVSTPVTVNRQPETQKETTEPVAYSNNDVAAKNIVAASKPVAAQPARPLAVQTVTPAVAKAAPVPANITKTPLTPVARTAAAKMTVQAGTDAARKVAIPVVSAPPVTVQATKPAAAKPMPATVTAAKPATVQLVSAARPEPVKIAATAATGMVAAKVAAQPAKQGTVAVPVAVPKIDVPLTKKQEQDLFRMRELRPRPNLDINQNEIMVFKKEGIRNRSLTDLTRIIFESLPANVGNVYKGQEKEYAAILLNSNRQVFQKKGNEYVCASDYLILHIPAYKSPRLPVVFPK